MESMFGKFPLANRPKMTRRKKKNMNIAPGASSTTSTGGTRRGGSSPTTEPTNNSTDAASRASSSTIQSPTASISRSGAHRRAKGIHQGRKRGGNPYNWFPSKDHPSSPTTDETVPITPRSDMSSTFSVSPSPGPSFRQPRSPVYERRNAISAGPQSTNFGFAPDIGTGTFGPASAPLAPTSTWPMSTTEVSQRFLEPTTGLAHTRSDSAFDPHNQTFNQRTNAGYNQPLPQTVTLCDPSQQSHLTNYPMTNEPSHSFSQLSSTRINRPHFAEQAFPLQNFQSTYPPGSAADHHLINPSDGFFLESPSAFAGLSDMTSTNYNELYPDANAINQQDFFVAPNPYSHPPMVDSGVENHLQSISPATFRVPPRPPQEQFSLAGITFSRARPAQ